MTAWPSSQLSLAHADCSGPLARTGETVSLVTARTRALSTFYGCVFIIRIKTTTAHTNHGNELSRETIRNKYCFTLLLLLLILGLHFALLLTFFLEGELRPRPNKGHATSEQILWMLLICVVLVQGWGGQQSVAGTQSRRYQVQTQLPRRGQEQFDMAMDCIISTNIFYTIIPIYDPSPMDWRWLHVAVHLGVTRAQYAVLQSAV